MLPIRLAAPIEAPRIVTGGKVRAAKRLPRKSHTCSMEMRSGDRAGQSIRSISLHSPTELFVSYCALTWCIVVR
ncbi:hypothetical protein TNCV_4037501 [Trichonephila clavipes]|nr:hypothetical protein TNCV_4037501 [Trichonephila clavipes]